MSVEVFDQHDLVIFRLSPAVQQGLSIRSQSQPESRFIHNMNESSLAAGAVEEFDPWLLGTGVVEEVNPAGRKLPVKPPVTVRLIQNTLFFSSVQGHFPYSWLFYFGVIKEAAIFGLSRIDAAVFLYPYRCAPLKRHFPQLQRSLLMAGIEIKPIC